MRAFLALSAMLVLAAFAGCASKSSGAVREVTIHIGYSADRTTQYVTPKDVAVHQGEKIRLVITNDDASGAADSFHDIAFPYASYGHIEHEVPAGQTTKTCLPQAEAGETCHDEAKSFFTASEKGRFKMWCEVGPLGRSNADGTPQTRHEQMGMWATLVVT